MSTNKNKVVAVVIIIISITTILAAGLISLIAPSINTQIKSDLCEKYTPTMKAVEPGQKFSLSKSQDKHNLSIKITDAKKPAVEISKVLTGGGLFPEKYDKCAIKQNFSFQYLYNDTPICYTENTIVNYTLGYETKCDFESSLQFLEDGYLFNNQNKVYDFNQKLGKLDNYIDYIEKDNILVMSPKEGFPYKNPRFPNLLDPFVLKDGLISDISLPSQIFPSLELAEYARIINITKDDTKKTLNIEFELSQKAYDTQSNGVSPNINKNIWKDRKASFCFFENKKYGPPVKQDSKQYIIQSTYQLCYWDIERAKSQN
ncbi:MAG: hypothetical protein WCK98_01330 [bacterium]